MGRRLAVDSRVGALAPDLRWDFPLRLFAGMNWLVLSGEATWDDVDEMLESRAAFLTRFAADTPVQTNEVGRAAAVAEGLRALDRPRIDLLELGCAGGLLLYADRYQGAPFEIVRRRGVDTHPVDVRTPEGALLLEAFVWPGQPARIERLRAAIDIVRADPPELIRGDYVELVTDLLEPETVVMTCVTTMYLSDERYAELTGKLRGADWLSLEGPRGAYDYPGMQLVLNGRVLAEHVDFHG